ncbi:MAG: radical SAM protein [Candidatus Aenigmatarchaeota archaeon]
MALGFSGSNGGISKDQDNASLNRLDLLNRPMEISYFVNNVCNLSCSHCYVGYEEPKNSLSVEEWKGVFDGCLDLGALTFGNVGKEPLLSWSKTKALLDFFALKRKQNPRIRFGLVTNAILFDDKKIEELAESSPTYMDISLDGTEEVHDSIRGKGNYQATLGNIRKISERFPELAEKIFISYTLMQPNKDIGIIKGLIDEIRASGVRNILISPYVKSINGRGTLGITNQEVVEAYKKLIEVGNEFVRKDGQLLLKSDYETQKPLIDLLVKEGVIDLSRLLIDDYGTIFNRYENVFVNYIPLPETMTRAIRFSHDGFVGGCYDMFFTDYQSRARGNVRTTNLKDILKESNPLQN